MPERGGKQGYRGGGIFSRVFSFLASAALCLSLLTVFAHDAAASIIISNFAAARSGDKITLTWTFSEAPLSNSYCYNIRGKSNDVCTVFDDGTAGPNTLDVQISALPANVELRFKISALKILGLVVSHSSWSGYISTAPLSQCSSQSGTDLQADCAVLETFYDSAGGANWTNKTNWKTANSLNTWHGVTVSNGRVSAIRLYENALTGTIPDLSSLAGLTKLDLGHNSLSGSISTASLDSLSSLSMLRLDSNSLSGTIPDLRSTGVRYLLLDDNELSGSIPAWFNIQGLRELSLHDNQLSGTIPDLSDVCCNDLDLSNNNLSGTIPAATHFPEEMRELQQGSRVAAGKLNLSNNNLSGAIPDLSSLNDLGTIDLSNNSLNGSMTAAHFPVDMWYLSLSDNELSGAIPDLTNLTKLSYLYLQNNRFSGTIPDLSSVGREVWLNGNSISGTIDVADFKNSLYFLYLHKNKLSNSSTIDLSSLSNLVEISLWGNPGLDLTKIMGLDLKLEKAALWILYDSTGGPGWTSSRGWPVGSNFGSWHGITTDSSGNVTGIELSENNLTGKINGGIAVLDSLEGLDLSCNSSLSGELPLGLKDIETLATVNICSTGMTVPSDQSFTTWKGGIIFTEGACSGAQACQAPVSQQSSPPPVSQSPDEGGGSGQGENETEDVRNPVPAPELPADDPGNIEAGGGCALVSGTGEERPGATVSGLLLAAFALLAVFRAADVGKTGRCATPVKAAVPPRINPG